MLEYLSILMKAKTCFVSLSKKINFPHIRILSYQKFEKKNAIHFLRVFSKYTPRIFSQINTPGHWGTRPSFHERFNLTGIKFLKLSRVFF